MDEREQQGILRLISRKKKMMLLDNVCMEQNQIQIQTYHTQSSVNDVNRDFGKKSSS